MRLYQAKKALKQAGSRINLSAADQSVLRDKVLAGVRRSEFWRASGDKIDFAPALWRVWLSSWLFLRPVGISLLIVAIITSSGVATVSAALTSLPGDAFYPVKITLEKAQIGLAFSNEKKAELEMAFASSRLLEVRKIIANEASRVSAGGDKTAQKTEVISQKIEKAMDHFTAGLKAVEKHLAAIQQDQSSEQSVVDISKIVNDKTITLEASLLDIKGQITQDLPKIIGELATSTPAQIIATTSPEVIAKTLPAVSSEKSLATIDKALDTVDDTNTKSLAMIVANAVAVPNNDTKQDAVEKLQLKIEKIEKKIEETEKKIDSITTTAATAAQNISDAPAAGILPNADKTASGTMAGVVLNKAEPGKQGSTTAETVAQVVKDVQKKPEEAKKSIEDAKKILGTNDSSKLTDVLNKVQETKAIVQEAKQEIKNVESLVKPAEKSN